MLHPALLLSMTIQDIQKITKGHLLQIQKRKEAITELSIDTRRIVNSAHTLFFALAGEQRNGLQYVLDAYEKGVRNFVVGEAVSEALKDANVLVVSNPIEALQMIGAHVRELHHYPVIAITGSNGKTIVKEWLSKILSSSAPFNEQAGIVKSPKSYNSQIGVPLSVWNMEEDNTIGVFEAGISKVGEMAVLAAILHPDIGIFTNIGDAHSEFFSSREEKMLEKFQLFQHSQHLITSLDIEKIQVAIKSLLKVNPNIDLFTWSEKEETATLFIAAKKIVKNQCQLKYIYQSKTYTIRIPFSQEAYIQNAINVLCALLFLKIPFENIKEGIAQLKAVAMRLEVRDAVNDSYIIADTYNSDISSLKVGLEFLSQQIKRKRTVILSDMYESGQDQEKLAKKIAQLLKEFGIMKFVGIGPEMITHRQAYEQIKGMETHFFETTEAFLQAYHPSLLEKENILLKGARVFEFERIQRRLELKIHHTVLEVNLEALSHNFKVYKKRIAKGTKLMAMVKAYSYGSGGLEIAQKLLYEGVDYLAVAYVDEGIELRKGGISLPIMVMSPEIHSFESMIRWRLEPEIFNLHSLQVFIEAANAQQEIHYPIHIKLDTGMHRLGFEAEGIADLLYELHHTETLRVASIFSHLATSDDLSMNAFTAMQAQRYTDMTETILSSLSYKPLLHLVNSAGIVNHLSLHKDMVRLGIGLYGIDSSVHIQQQLMNVTTLKTYIVQIRSVAPSETIGYSRRGQLSRPSIIATVAIGYADGYFRDFGNRVGYMLVRGQQAPVVGSVCMDMCMIDVTDITNVQEGDEVVVFGKELPVVQLAEWADTISYEILTSISKRVKRIYVNE